MNINYTPLPVRLPAEDRFTSPLLPDNTLQRQILSPNYNSCFGLMYVAKKSYSSAALQLFPLVHFLQYHMFLYQSCPPNWFSSQLDPSHIPWCLQINKYLNLPISIFQNNIWYYHYWCSSYKFSSSNSPPLGVPVINYSTEGS